MRSELEIDGDVLKAVLRERLGPANRFELEPLGQGGASNPTYRLDWGDRALILRRAPGRDQTALDYGPLHRVVHEFRLMDALRNTPVPVPEVCFLCEDTTVLGEVFYVMERIAGDTTRQDEPERFGSPPQRERLSREYLRGLIGLHSVDPQTVDVPSSGDTGEYTKRVVERCRRQQQRVTEITARVRRVPRLEEIGSWLEDHRPDPVEPRIVHGDYKVDNLMVAPGRPPRLAAVLDWEMSGVGDPRADLGWFLSYWSDPEDPEYDAPRPEFLSERGFMEREGYLRRRELVELYEEKTGIRYGDDRFYRTLAIYKLAVILEGFFAGYLTGRTDHALYPVFEELVPFLAAHGEAVLEGLEPL